MNESSATKICDLTLTAVNAFESMANTTMIIIGFELKRKDGSLIVMNRIDVVMFNFIVVIDEFKHDFFAVTINVVCLLSFSVANLQLS